MREPIERRVVGLCGISSAILLGIIGVIPPPPPVGAAASVVVPYFSEHQVGVLVLNYLGLLGLLPFLVVLAYVSGAVRRAEGSGWLSILVLLTGGLFSAAGFVVLALLQIVAYCALHTTPDVAKALNDATSLTFAMMFLAAAGFNAAFTWANVNTRLWPAWLGLSSMAVAIASIVASFGSIATDGLLAAGGPATLVAFGAFLLWLLAFGGLIVVRRPSS